MAALMSRCASFRPDPVPSVDAAARRNVLHTLRSALLRWSDRCVADLPGVPPDAVFMPWIDIILDRVNSAVHQLPDGLSGLLCGSCIGGLLSLTWTSFLTMSCLIAAVMQPGPSLAIRVGLPVTVPPPT